MLSRKNSSALSGRCLFLLLAVTLGCRAAEPFTFQGFQGLGFLSEPEAFSTAYGISADGATVIGASAVGEYGWSFRWSNGVMTPLPKSNETSIYLSQANAVSADGSVIVGMEFDFSTYTTMGYRWSTTDGLQILPYNPGTIDNNVGSADAVSADGSLVAGYAPDAYVWTAGSADTTPLPTLAGSSSNHAHGISADGSVVVGASGNNNASGFAFRWSAAEGTQPLTITNAVRSDATAVSGDASTIVGSFMVASSASETAFAWTALGVVTLGSLSIDEGTVSQVFSVNHDGNWAVGVSDDRAALWDTRTGSVWDLNDFVTSQAGFSGWTLESATGISADGRRIVGNGVNANGSQEAWMLEFSAIPEPGSVGMAVLAMGAAVLRRRRA